MIRIPLVSVAQSTNTVPALAGPTRIRRTPSQARVLIWTWLALVLGVCLWAPSGEVTPHDVDRQQPVSADTAVDSQRLLDAVRALVERTLEVRAQRDVLVLQAVRRPGARPAEGWRSAGLPGTPQISRRPLGFASPRLREVAAGVEEPARFPGRGEWKSTLGLNARALNKAKRLVALAGAEGIRVEVVAGYARDVRPNPLLRSGGTDPLFAAHGTGLAFDIVVLSDARTRARSSEALKRVGAIGKTLGLRWGGDLTHAGAWSHFELPGARSALR